MMAVLDLKQHPRKYYISSTARAFLPDCGSWKNRIITSEKMGGYARHILLVRQKLSSMMRERRLDRSDLFLLMCDNDQDKLHRLVLCNLKQKVHFV